MAAFSVHTMEMRVVVRVSTMVSVVARGQTAGKCDMAVLTMGAAANNSMADLLAAAASKWRRLRGYEGELAVRRLHHLRKLASDTERHELEVSALFRILTKL